MEPVGSMPHSQGLSNNSYPEPNQHSSPSRFILILASHLRLDLPKGLFPVGLPVKILKALLPSSILLHAHILSRQKKKKIYIYLMFQSTYHVFGVLGKNFSLVYKPKFKIRSRQAFQSIEIQNENSITSNFDLLHSTFLFQILLKYIIVKICMLF